MTTILFLFTMVAAGSSGREYLDWRAIAEFSNPATCQSAIKALGIEQSRARCIAKG